MYIAQAQWLRSKQSNFKKPSGFSGGLVITALAARHTELEYYRVMAESVYIESSVISYLVARPSRDVVITARQAITETWWRERRAEFELYISTLVLQEIGRGDTEAAEMRLNAVEDIPLLAITPEAQSLAEDLIVKGAIPANSEEDALHIGLGDLEKIKIHALLVFLAVVSVVIPVT